MTESSQKSTVDITALDRGDQFVGPDGQTRYEVVTPANEHDRGWVDVRDLSMTDDEAFDLLERPGAVAAGTDPRAGFFAYSTPVQVTRADEDQAADTDGM